MSDGLRLMSAILATGSAGALLQIDPESLIDQERTAYDFVRAHFRQYRSLPETSTVQAETGVRLPVANETLQYYLDQVGDRHSYNLIRDHYTVFREGIQSRDMDVVSEQVSNMQAVLRRRSRGRAGEAINIDEGLQLVSERLTQIRGTGGVTGITTDWPLFDSITGGYQNADLVTWVGRPSLGKTYIALRQAQKAHDAGESVLFVTTEMGAEQIARRYVALSLGLNPTFLKNGTVSTHMERRLRTLCTGLVGAERFKLFSVGMNSKVSSIAALCEEFMPTVVFIDGVYLLKPTELARNASRTDRVSAVYDELKGLTLEVNRPFIATTQFNRQAGKGGKEGSLETIGFSDAIGTHSSIVVALKGGTGENAKHHRVFEFLKGREGETGEVAINFKFAPLDMDEMSPEDREDAGEDAGSVAWMGGSRRSV